LIRHKYGKGQAVLFNFAIYPYFALQYGDAFHFHRRMKDAPKVAAL
jgi:hypothetical protein